MITNNEIKKIERNNFNLHEYYSLPLWRGVPILSFRKHNQEVGPASFL